MGAKSCWINSGFTHGSEGKSQATVRRWSSIQKYILPLAKLLNAEIAIIDAYGIYVGGSSLYKKVIGMQVPKDNVLSYSLRSGEKILVLNPGEDIVCKMCSKREYCSDMANFTGPIIVNKKIIAVVQIVAFTHIQRTNLIKKAENAFNLISHIINFVWEYEIYDHIKKDTPVDTAFNGLVGESEAMQSLKRNILKIAGIDSTVLIQGESGTGKELVARAIHNHSSRQDKPFVAVNCGAIPEHLMESELFGYAPGSFSGADRKGRHGLFEQAMDGVLFLDEISELPIRLQVKLLRVLQEHTVRRIGEATVRPINTRIIAATNTDLKQLVSQGHFRQDLFFRLDVIPIFVPPLRERKEDLKLLIEFFLQQFSTSKNKRYIITTTLYNHFERYQWPGNIRELKNFVEYGVTFCENGILTEELLLHRFDATEVPPASENSRTSLSVSQTSTQSLSPSSQNERDILVQLLEQHRHEKGGKKQIAATLGISLATLYRKIQYFGLNSR